MRVLLDTHTLIWWALGDPKLSRKARSVLSSFDSDVFVSAASAWEIATKVRIGKLRGAEAFASGFPAPLERLGFRGVDDPDRARAACGTSPGRAQRPI
jgi:PIN domain nuclease of toxin-antitoxin system